MAIQNAIAQERAIPRILWIPVGVEAVDPRQEAFLASVRQHSGSEDAVEVVETSLEDLKTIVLDKLRATEKARGPAKVTGESLRLYLICDQRDRADATPLRDHLLQSGFEAVLPLVSGDTTQIREDHEDNLLVCDGAIVFWGVADEFWL